MVLHAIAMFSHFERCECAFCRCGALWPHRTLIIDTHWTEPIEFDMKITINNGNGVADSFLAWFDLWMVCFTCHFGAGAAWAIFDVQVCLCWKIYITNAILVCRIMLINVWWYVYTWFCMSLLCSLTLNVANAVFADAVLCDHPEHRGMVIGDWKHLDYWWKW